MTIHLFKSQRFVNAIWFGVLICVLLGSQSALAQVSKESVCVAKGAEISNSYKTSKDKEIQKVQLCKSSTRLKALWEGECAGLDKSESMVSGYNRNIQMFCNSTGANALSNSAPATPSRPSTSTASDGRADPSNRESMQCFDTQMKSAKQFNDELATVKGNTKAENAIRVRRYQAQKALFEGQCAGTPQAAKQVALADARLKELGAAGGSGASATSSTQPSSSRTGGTAAERAEAQAQIDRARNAAEANARRQAEQAAAQSGVERTVKQQESDAWLAQQAARATECVTPIKHGLYGAFKNTCDYKVWVTMCAWKPKPDSWTTWFDCEKPRPFGLESVGAKSIQSAHVIGAETIYWFACSDPHTPLNPVFERGKGIRATCKK